MGLGLCAVVDNSEARRGNKIRSAHPPGLYEHGLVTVRKLDIDRLCLHGRDNLDHFARIWIDESGVLPATDRTAS